MKLIVLMMSVIAFDELAGASISNRLEQLRINLIEKCMEESDSDPDHLRKLGYELDKSINDMWLECEVPEDDGDDIGKYLELDLLTDQLTCRQNIVEKCETSVQKMAHVYLEAYFVVTMCDDWKFWITFFESCPNIFGQHRAYN